MSIDQCENCGITVQSEDHVCLACGARLKTVSDQQNGNSASTAGTVSEPCEKCGKITSTKYYQFLYGIKIGQEADTKSGEFMPRTHYAVGGQDGAWLCARHRWTAPKWSYYIAPVAVLLLIPAAWMVGVSHDVRIWVSILAGPVALGLCALSLLDGLDNNAETHAIALKSQRHKARGWNAFFTTKGFAAWRRTDEAAEQSNLDVTIELTNYQAFLEQLCMKRNQTPSEVQKSLYAICAGCGGIFTDEGLSYLAAMGPASSYRQRMGDNVVILNPSQTGKNLREGKCPTCGCLRMRIRAKG